MEFLKTFLVLQNNNKIKHGESNFIVFGSQNEIRKTPLPRFLSSINTKT
jgi:hypothetical protein